MIAVTRLCPHCRQPLPDIVRDPKALTQRENEVALLISNGRRNKDIAALLHIEVGTVRNHVHAILKKQGLFTRKEIAFWVKNTYEAD